MQADQTKGADEKRPLGENLKRVVEATAEHLTLAKAKEGIDKAVHFLEETPPLILRPKGWKKTAEASRKTAGQYKGDVTAVEVEEPLDDAAKEAISNENAESLLAREETQQDASLKVSAGENSPVTTASSNTKEHSRVQQDRSFTARDTSKGPLEGSTPGSSTTTMTATAPVAARTSQSEDFVTSASNLIVMGPAMELLTADPTIIFTVALAVTASSWMLVGFALGRTVSYYEMVMKSQGEEHALLQQAGTATSGPEMTPPLQKEMNRTVEKEPDSAGTRQQQGQRKKKHGLFLKLMGWNKGGRETKQYQFGDITRSVLRHQSALWTNLMRDSSEKKPAWARNIDPLEDRENELIRFLVQRRRQQQQQRQQQQGAPEKQNAESKAENVASSKATEDKEEVSGAASSTTTLGAVSLSTTLATTFLEDDESAQFQPLFRLRGIDGFLAEELEADVATHPWLIQQGLRDVPTCIINVLSKYGHLLIYFEMQEWIQDWHDSIEACEEDSTAVAGFKRFLRADDAYRNARIKVVPFIVDGPRVVKMLVPQKKELLLNCEYLKVSFKKYNGGDVDGRKLHPALEVTLDCISNGWMRSATGIVKRNIERISVDLAAVIGRPVGHEDDDDEPEMCIGLWRFHYLDTSSCPYFPDRASFEAQAKGQDADHVRAETLMMAE